MIIDDREKFLRYAIPCGGVLVERGSLEPAVLERLRNALLNGREPRDSLEESFPVAARMTEIIAKRLGKDSVDSEVIDRYFLHEHDQAVLWRAGMFPDIKVDECMIQPGRILSVQGDRALVNTPRGELSLRRDFLPESRRGDLVTVHYDYISEAASRAAFERLLKVRK